MIKRGLALGVASALVLAGCTSGGTVAPSPTGPRTVTVTATAPAPTASTAATCSPSPTDLSFRRHIVAFAGQEFSLAPTGRAVLHTLPRVTIVRALATQLGAPSGLVPRVGRHWHKHLAALGQTTASHGLTSSIGLHNRSSSKNVSYAVFRFATVYTGTFTNACGSRLVTGRYTTFGAATTAVFTCGRPAHGALARVAKPLCI